MSADPYEGEFTASDVIAWREGDWYFVNLDGRLIGRRYSRSGDIVAVEVRFNSCQSPRKARTWSTLNGKYGAGTPVMWLTAQSRRSRDTGHYDNFIYKELNPDITIKEIK